MNLRVATKLFESKNYDKLEFFNMTEIIKQRAQDYENVRSVQGVIPIKDFILCNSNQLKLIHPIHFKVIYNFLMKL